MAFDHRLDSRHHMTRSGFSRRAFLHSSSIAIGAAGVGLGLPDQFGAPRYGWLPTVSAQSVIYDPVPDPIAAGWTKEGNEPYFPVGTSLRVTDTSNIGFVRFFVDALPLFAGEVELNPSFMVGSGYTVDAEGYLGAHVAINDGDRQVKAALLHPVGAGMRIALGLTAGYSRGFLLPTMHATFKVKRLTDGSAYSEPPPATPSIWRHSSPLGRRATASTP